ncbi:unnamed protein product [Tuber aestivum]|uniref:Uncharacterized protein n=1 Tax=Tuber aestivum TaxID=59557 RepID=A0A292PYT8_9PEZI|nr:unnamed protein product [Tuber aestivum]
MKHPLLATRFPLRHNTSSPNPIDVDLVAPGIPRAGLYLILLEALEQLAPFANPGGGRGSGPNGFDNDFDDEISEGELLSAARASSPSGNSSVARILDSERNNYIDIVPGVASRITVGDSVIENSEMAFAKDTNASFGIMGLGKYSVLLDRLKKEGNIGAKAFSLWIGSGAKRSRDWDADARNKTYPGSLIPGGYDPAKQKGDSRIRGPYWGGKDGALDVEIDSSVPGIYLPPALSVWYEDYSYVGSPNPSFMPITNYTGSTAIFSRAFLKAVYLAVNYETEFQVAPASFSIIAETPLPLATHATRQWCLQ